MVYNNFQLILHQSKFYVIYLKSYNLFNNNFRALQPPGWLKEWHVGVRVIKSSKLVGFISAIPALVNVYNKYAVLFLGDI